MKKDGDYVVLDKPTIVGIRYAGKDITSKPEVFNESEPCFDDEPEGYVLFDLRH